MLSKSIGNEIEVTGEKFEELVLLTVAAQHDEAYGVSIKDELEEALGKKVNISAIHVALKRMDEKGFVSARFGGLPRIVAEGGRSFM